MLNGKDESKTLNHRSYNRLNGNQQPDDLNLNIIHIIEEAKEIKKEFW